MKIVLASGSPRRREILADLGIEFEVITSDADESYDETLSVGEIVEHISRKKGEAVRDMLAASGRDLSDTLIISADTVVSASGEILGKPSDAEDARRMLRMYSGTAHSVFSGVTVICGNVTASAHEETLVHFSSLSEWDIDKYISSGECFDKAGAYGIQGLASVFITGIDGCYLNVVGLPVARLRTLLSESFDIDITELMNKEI